MKQSQIKGTEKIDFSRLFSSIALSKENTSKPLTDESKVDVSSMHHGSKRFKSKYIGKSIVLDKQNDESFRPSTVSETFIGATTIKELLPVSKEKLQTSVFLRKAESFKFPKKLSSGDSIVKSTLSLMHEKEALRVAQKKSSVSITSPTKNDFASFLKLGINEAEISHTIEPKVEDLNEKSAVSINIFHTEEGQENTESIDHVSKHDKQDDLKVCKSEKKKLNAKTTEKSKNEDLSLIESEILSASPSTSIFKDNILDACCGYTSRGRRLRSTIAFQVTRMVPMYGNYYLSEEGYIKSCGSTCRCKMHITEDDILSITPPGGTFGKLSPAKSFLMVKDGQEKSNRTQQLEKLLHDERMKAKLDVDDLKNCIVGQQHYLHLLTEKAQKCLCNLQRLQHELILNGLEKDEMVHQFSIIRRADNEERDHIEKQVGAALAYAENKLRAALKEYGNKQRELLYDKKGKEEVKKDRSKEPSVSIYDQSPLMSAKQMIDNSPAKYLGKMERILKDGTVKVEERFDFQNINESEPHVTTSIAEQKNSQTFMPIQEQETLRQSMLAPHISETFSSSMMVQRESPHIGDAQNLPEHSVSFYNTNGEAKSEDLNDLNGLFVDSSMYVNLPHAEENIEAHQEENIDELLINEQGVSLPAVSAPFTRMPSVGEETFEEKEQLRLANEQLQALCAELYMQLQYAQTTGAGVENDSTKEKVIELQQYIEDIEKAWNDREEAITEEREQIRKELENEWNLIEKNKEEIEFMFNKEKQKKDKMVEQKMNELSEEYNKMQNYWQSKSDYLQNEHHMLLDELDKQQNNVYNGYAAEYDKLVKTVEDLRNMLEQSEAARLAAEELAKKNEESSIAAERYAEQCDAARLKAENYAMKQDEKQKLLMNSEVKMSTILKNAQENQKDLANRLTNKANDVERLAAENLK